MTPSLNENLSGNYPETKGKNGVGPVDLEATAAARNHLNSKR
jgi:hypothetical protein